MTIFETEKISQKRVSIITNITLLVMAGCAAFSVGFVNV